MVQFKDDFSALDQEKILHFIFYPRRSPVVRSSTPKATDYKIPVDQGVSIGCRFHLCSIEAPNILYFHGNGEIVTDYDDIAPMYEGIGVNLFVTDYRGYGFSNGAPTVTHMIADAHKIFESFINILKKEGHIGKAFVMGRSLGSASAIELACNYPNQIDGLIIESGFASIPDLLEARGLPLGLLNLSKETESSNLSNIRSISMPTLIIHAMYDQLIPLSQGKALFDNLPVKDKRMLIIPDADHNNIMFAGIEKYFKAIKEFIFT
ncbi:MAG: alpha/beta hydrolase [Thermodesulfobacteriota bacterium]|nr:alpha/beta hydrolase [Thermodesulfobacteriota bacterium]